MGYTAKQLNLAFIKSEQKVSENLIALKMVSKNAYYGKIPDAGSWPLESGTRLKGLRLGRVGVPNDAGWTPVEDELCRTNACGPDDAEVISHGNSEFFYSLVQRDLRTDWICLDSAALRSHPKDEIMHIEDGLRRASRYVHEEFRRSRYLQFCRNKLMSIIPLDGSDAVQESFESADGSEMINQAFVFETRDSGEMDETALRVCFDLSADNASLRQIGELTLDQLDYASERLAYEDESYLPQVGLFDVLVAGGRTKARLAEIENEDMQLQGNVGGYNMIDLSRAYGTEGVLRNYSIRQDVFAPRFYPDTDFNTALLASDGYAFDAEDPNSWPRFVRVFPYVQKRSGKAGVEWVTNENYLKAPFGLSTILTPSVMEIMSFPDVSGFSSAQKEGDRQGYDGTAKWINPDWKENLKRNSGFWLMGFRMAAKQNRDELGYAWFHRISNRFTMRGADKALATPTVYSEVTPYCYSGIVGNDKEVGGNLVTEEG